MEEIKKAKNLSELQNAFYGPKSGRDKKIRKGEIIPV